LKNEKKKMEGEKIKEAAEDAKKKVAKVAIK